MFPLFRVVTSAATNGARSASRVASAVGRRLMVADLPADSVYVSIRRARAKLPFTEDQARTKVLASELCEPDQVKSAFTQPVPAGKQRLLFTISDA